MSSEVLAELNPSTARRSFALVVIYGLSALVIYLAISTAPDTLLILGLFAISGGFLYVAEMMRRRTTRRIVLTREALSEEGGEVLAQLSEIERVDRSMFAFKPSNGFLVILAKKHARHWAPGLWWRFGRYVGVGGVTSAGEARAMADVITLLVKERDATSD